MAKEVTYTILDGPIRKNFLDGFGKAYPLLDGMRLCEFKLLNGSEATIIAHIRLNMIKHHDDSSNKFDFEGLFSDIAFDEPIIPDISGASPCTGYYDVCRQNGWIKVNLDK